MTEKGTKVYNSPNFSGIAEWGRVDAEEMIRRDLSVLTKGAQLLAQLRRIPRGMALDVPAKEFDDVMLPPETDPLVAMNAEEKAEWLHSRLPFPCDLTYNLEKDRWRFWHRDES